MDKLPNGKYTLVLESIHTIKIDRESITMVFSENPSPQKDKINPILIEDIVIPKESKIGKCLRFIFNFEKRNNVTRRFSQQHKYKSGINLDNETNIGFIIYGIRGFYNYVSRSVWDYPFRFNDKSYPFVNIDMGNSKRIENLPKPLGPRQPATKEYVDDNLPSTTEFLKLDGSRAMTGNLQMDKHYIEDLETPNYVPITDLVNYRKDAYRAANKEYLRKNFLKKDGDDYNLRQKIIKNCEPYYPDLFSDNDLVSKAFVDAEISKLPKPDPDVLKLDGSKAMQGSLNMNNQSIINLKMPLNPPDDCAINFKYLDSNFLNLKSTKKMEAKLDMNLFDIINLPTADSNELVMLIMLIKQSVIMILLMT